MGASVVQCSRRTMFGKPWIAVAVVGLDGGLGIPNGGEPEWESLPCVVAGGAIFGKPCLITGAMVGFDGGLGIRRWQ